MKPTALACLAALVCPSLLAAPASLGARPAEADEPRLEAQAQEHYLRGVERLCGTRVKRDAELAALWVRMAADEGHRGAQSLLGWMAMTGTGMRRDDLRAATWLQEAAARGDVAAQNNLGVLYATGAGVKQDAAEAARWFRAAAASRAPAAARNLKALANDAGVQGAGERPLTAPPAPRPAQPAADCRPIP